MCPFQSLNQFWGYKIWGQTMRGKWVKNENMNVKIEMTTVHIRIWRQICLKNLTRKRLEKINFEVVIRIWQCACLALTGEIRGTSKEKIYQELGLESLQIRRWYRKLCLFYKIYKNQSPSYLYNIIPITNTHYTFRNSDKIPYFKSKHKFFKNSFFGYNWMKQIRPQSTKMR